MQCLRLNTQNQKRDSELENFQSKFWQLEQVTQDIDELRNNFSS